MRIERTAAIVAALAAWLGPALPSFAAGMPAELAELKAQIDLLRQSYEARLQALERRLAELQAQPLAEPIPSGSPAASAPSTAAVASPGAAAPPVRLPRDAANGSASAGAFNPAVALILAGGYTHLSRDPANYRLQGFIPSGGEVGPGRRGFGLGESELSLAASIDPVFSGRLTAAFGGDDSVAIEEAWFEGQGLVGGATLRGGRFLSSIGYLNDRHAHTWDFVDAPLAYQAFFGGPLKTDGVHLRWLAPTPRFLELGLELGSGATFPGNSAGRNRIGSMALFAHTGDDLGDNASWRTGVSVLQHRADDRRFDAADATGTPVSNGFTGRSRTLVLDGVLKWAPGGNARRTNFTLQGEYFRRIESGEFTHDTQALAGGPFTGDYRATPSGWYAQAVYQFMPMWRAGVRYDRLDSGRVRLGAGGPGNGDVSILQRAQPSRASLMVDYAWSEFSRLRLQLGADRSHPAFTDRQVFLQYIMSLGAHGAHRF